jgi:acid stress-induced BolA-like protein IbaG/YrbA
MNYVLSESQFNAISRVHEQLQLLADIGAQVRDNEIHVRTLGFIGTIHQLENQLQQTLKDISEA